MRDKEEVLSVPYDFNREVKSAPENSGFGLYETIGFRETQEDAAYRCSFATSMFDSLTPLDIGHRLWTTYKLLDARIIASGITSGTTATTTVHDGKGHLMTATLADSVAFAAVYDKEGNVLGVTRLNSITHKPGAEDERKRIETAGGVVVDVGDVPRVRGGLAVSRAMGDVNYKHDGVCSDANIDVTTIDKICADLKLAPENIGSIQVIATCDGFTDGAGNHKQTKADHEEYLLKILQTMKSPGKKTEVQLAEELAKRALEDGSRDNISIAIQTLVLDKACLVGVYDGHSGAKASTFVANHIGTVFEKQCALTKESYEAQVFSVMQQQTIYMRDNQRNDVEGGILVQKEAVKVETDPEKTIIVDKDEVLSVLYSFCKEVKCAPKNSGFGLYETIGFRESQEDAVYRCSFATSTFDSLTPLDIGHRLWTTYKLLDARITASGITSGTTATTTVHDGKGHLMTATLADSVAFAAVYDKEGNVLGVTRLNSITHKPGEEVERKRIEAAGGVVVDVGDVPRVRGGLAVSRAMGDVDYKHDGVCSDANIDVTTIDKICADLKLAPENIGSIQVIATCDGFTDGAGNHKQTKADHEEYLLKILQTMKSPGKKTEVQLAEELAKRAIEDGSIDNISIAIQTLVLDKACLVGVYDGHSGAKASTFVANHIGTVFEKQCALTKESYEAQVFSVTQQQTIYMRDNQRNDVEGGILVQKDTMAAAGRHPSKFFQPKSTQYTKALDILERQVPLAIGHSESSAAEGADEGPIPELRS